MWLSDAVYIQSKEETNVYGAISIVWTAGASTLCDVQPMSKEKALKEYGLTDSNRWLEVFAPSGTAFVEGYQVKYNNKQWLVRLVQHWSKIGGTNHTFAVLSIAI